jgi:hypothetical protein
MMLAFSSQETANPAEGVESIILDIMMLHSFI